MRDASRPRDSDVIDPVLGSTAVPLAPDFNRFNEGALGSTREILIPLVATFFGAKLTMLRKSLCGDAELGSERVAPTVRKCGAPFNLNK